MLRSPAETDELPPPSFELDVTIGDAYPYQEVMKFS